jgi:hypothetical protein
MLGRYSIPFPSQLNRSGRKLPHCQPPDLPAGRQAV